MNFPLLGELSHITLGSICLLPSLTLCENEQMLDVFGICQTSAQL